MGFLDDLFGNNSGHAAECLPDKPIPFGYKENWLCVKADSSEEVIQKLGLKNPRACNWENAFKKLDNDVFVSPVLEGYVLVIGWGTDILTENPNGLDNAAAQFPELQYFANHGVVDYYAWVKYIDGKMVRGYCWCGESGEVILNGGEPTPEETALGFTNFIPDNDADWDDYEMPDEETVMEIAAAWGIDTAHIDKYPESAGVICGC